MSRRAGVFNVFDSKYYSRFVGESEDSMRVLMLNDNLLSIKKDIAVAEMRVAFNGRDIRLCQSFGWDAEKVQKLFAEEIPLYPDGSSHEGVGEAAAADPGAAENSDPPAGAPADDGVMEDVPDPGAPEGEKGSNNGDMERESDAGAGDGLAVSGGGETDGGDD